MNVKNEIFLIYCFTTALLFKCRLFVHVSVVMANCGNNITLFTL